MKETQFIINRKRVRKKVLTRYLAFHSCGKWAFYSAAFEIFYIILLAIVTAEKYPCKARLSVQFYSKNSILKYEF